MATLLCFTLFAAGRSYRTTMKPETTPLHPLVALVCGYEKSGTTLLNEILRRHPQLDSGHEVGVLMGDSPRDFPNAKIYFAFFQQTWKLSKAQAQHCCDTDVWSEFYRRAREASPVIADKASLIFDKTPRYMLTLADVMAKAAPLPCVVNVRDPRAVMHSWACWSGHRDDPGHYVEAHFSDYCERYLSYAQGYQSAVAQYADRLYLNQFEQMCLQPEATIDRIFAFLGLEFEPAYLHFESEHFVYGSTVSQAYLQPYLKDFSDALSQRILDATSAFADWHFQP